MAARKAPVGIIKKLSTRVRSAPAGAKRAWTVVRRAWSSAGNKVRVFYTTPSGKLDTRKVVVTATLAAAAIGGAYVVRRHKGKLALQRKK